MKKTTKILAVILAMITLMSSFSIMSGAINSKSSAKELLNYYEDCLIKTSAKEDIIQGKYIWKTKETADYSPLKGKDLEETKAENEIWNSFTGEWVEDTYNKYYHGDAYKEYYWEGRSEFIDFFSIKRDIRRYGLEFKSAKYSKAKNGDVTLEFVYLSGYEDVDITRTYTVKIDKNNYVKSYSIKRFENNTYPSVEGTRYPVTYESVDTYSFVYNKVKVKDIELSENRIVLGKDEECYITATVKPDNATYKGVYTSDDIDTYVANCGVFDEGVIQVWANGEGETSFEVYAYGGEAIATVEVVVEYTIFERVAELFENLYYDIYWFFYDLFIGFEDDVIIEEEIYEEVTYVEEPTTVITDCHI